MKKTLFVSVLLTFLPALSISQGIGKLNHNFISDYEEKVFGNLIDSAVVDPLALLVAITPKSEQGTYNNAKLQIETFVKRLDAKKLANPKHEKVIKYIFKEVHSHFLRKYEINAFFSDVFLAGLYNCVSASALYALVFDELNIPYEIQELPTHVYLIAYPDEERITVETTDPLKGYVTHDFRFKKEYVEFLHKTKLISEQEYRSSSVDKLFGEHFYGDKSVDISVLAAFQYYNEGLSYLMKENKDIALEYFKKSYQIHQHAKTKYLCVLLMEDAQSSRQFDSMEDVEVFIELYKILPEKYNKENVSNDFKFFSSKYLFEKNDVKTYDQIYNLFQTNLTDSVVMNEVSFWYHLFKGGAFGVQNKIDAAFRQFCMAHQYNPDNLYLKDDLKSSVRMKVFNGLDHTESELITRLSELDYLRKEFPFLNSHSDFIGNYLILGSYIINHYMNYNQVSKALEYATRFEQEFRVDDFTEAKRMWSVQYHRIGYYYEFRKNRRSTAMKYYKRGFELDPGNYDLKLTFDRLNFGS